MSGKVTFSDGQQADWYLDQTGRLGVIPKQQGYKPSPMDVQEFQLALQDELAKLGFDTQSSATMFHRVWLLLFPATSAS